MKIPEWHQNVLLVSDDPEIKPTVTHAFGKETNLVSVQNTHDAIAHLEKSSFHVLIIDAKTTNPTLSYSEESKEVSFTELLQYSNQLNFGITTILLVNKLLARHGDFARKCGATLIMDRKNISTNRMVYMIRVMRKRTFRTILGRDIPPGSVFSIDLYHYLPMNQRYDIFLPAGVSFTEDKLHKIQSSNTRHLYLKESDLGSFLTTLRGKNQGVHFSEELSSIRNQLRQIMVELFDISTDGMVHYGHDVYDRGLDITARLEALISRFPDTASCLRELPYPRWSALAHSLNCAIYSIIFSKHCQLGAINEIAFAAMLHNVGLADIDQDLLQKKESDLTPKELEQYKKHINISMDLLRNKLVPFTPLVEQMILNHHENYDGTGFPNALAGVNLPIECAMVSIVSSFDYFNTVRPGERLPSPEEAWQRLKKFHGDSTVLKKKFHPKLLDQLDDFFSKNFP